MCVTFGALAAAIKASDISEVCGASLSLSESDPNKSKASICSEPEELRLINTERLSGIQH